MHLIVVFIQPNPCPDQTSHDQDIVRNAETLVGLSQEKQTRVYVWEWSMYIQTESS